MQRDTKDSAVTTVCCVNVNTEQLFHKAVEVFEVFFPFEYG